VSGTGCCSHWLYLSELFIPPPSTLFLSLWLHCNSAATSLFFTRKLRCRRTWFNLDESQHKSFGKWESTQALLKENMRSTRPYCFWFLPCAEMLLQQNFIFQSIHIKSTGAILSHPELSLERVWNIGKSFSSSDCENHIPYLPRWRKKNLQTTHIKDKL